MCTISFHSVDRLQLGLAMNLHGNSSRRWRPFGGSAIHWWGALFLGVAVYLGQLLSIALRVPPAKVSTIWIPIGLLMAALILVPTRRRWSYLASGFGAQIIGFANDASLALVVPFVIVVFLPQIAAAFLLRRIAPGGLSFDRFVETLRFVLFFVAAAILTGMVGALISLLGGLRTDFWVPASRMTLTTALATTIITPLLVAMVQTWRGRVAIPATIRLIEGTCLAALTFVVAFAVFGGEWTNAGAKIWLLYSPLPLLLWAAVRFGPAWTSAASLIVVLVSTWDVVHGKGPFASEDTGDRVLSLQLFLFTLAVPMLLLASLIRERTQTVARLFDSEQESLRQLAHLDTVYRTAPVGLAFVDANLCIRSINDHLAELSSRPAEAHIGRELHELFPMALAAELESIYRRVLDDGKPILDVEICGTTLAHPGEPRTWVANYFPVRDATGRILGINTVVRDITEEKRADEALRRTLVQVQDLAGRLITAQESERTRIARELHDDVNQRLAALAIGISGLKRRLGGNSPAMLADLSILQQSLVELTNDIRRMSHDLHPGILQHAGLMPALEARCSEFRHGQSISIALASEGPVNEISAEASLCLYRVTQEALQNIARHAHAHNVRIDLRREPTAVNLKISDDGSGFDWSERGQRDDRGLGLLSIDERVRLLHGRITIDTKPGHGTILLVTIPLGT
jgi:PAS domain S-box-containing protein